MVWCGVVPKASEAEFPLLSLGVALPGSQDGERKEQWSGKNQLSGGSHVPQVSSPLGRGRPGPRVWQTPDCSRGLVNVTTELEMESLKETTLLLDTLNNYGTEEERVEDPMVNGPIYPFIIPVTLWNKHTHQGKEFGALIASGCTRCSVTQAVLDKLGLWVIRLIKPLKFEQVDGSILGGLPATHRTEPVNMVMGERWEWISLVVVSHMTEALILGLAWLDKREPTIR
ncbi:hypothetical protein E2320_008072 [Naja naja]|nr:hypothetical protein E2320_008072 [Naja naja]